MRISTGPNPGTMGMAGYVAGAAEYKEKQRAIERQQRQQDIDNIFRGVSLAAGMVSGVASPFINSAAAKHTAHWQNDLAIKKQQAADRRARDPETIRLNAEADAERQLAGQKAAIGLQNKGLEYLRSIGPAGPERFISRPNGDRVRVGGGSGMLDDAQMLRAIRQLDGRVVSMGGQAAASADTSADRFQRAIHTDTQGNRFVIGKNAHGDTITALDNPQRDRQQAAMKEATTYFRTQDAAYGQKLADKGAQLTERLALSGKTQPQIDDAFDGLARNLKKNWPKPPEQFREFFPSRYEQQDDFDRTPLHEVDVNPNPNVPPLPKRTLGDPQGDNIPVTKPESFTDGPDINELERERQRREQEKLEVDRIVKAMKRGHEATAQDLPKLAQIAEDPRFRKKLVDMGGVKFHNTKERFDSRKLVGALDIMRQVNHIEMDSMHRNKMVLSMTGEQGRKQHSLRMMAADWLQRSMEQYELSVQNEKGIKGGRPTLWNKKIIQIPPDLDEAIEKPWIVFGSMSDILPPVNPYTETHGGYDMPPEPYPAAGSF